MALGKSGEENRAPLIVLCALFALSCKGEFRWVGEGFYVLCDLVTSARDLYLFVEAHGSVYYIFEAL